ncbi:MAG: rhomboid family intramembrane serine protease [Succinivibrio sp.]|nr:rhomboid family intramembrane serine protease [Succinivibrio sp.]
MAEFKIVEEYPYEVAILPYEKALAFVDYLNSIRIKSQAVRRADGHYVVCVAWQDDVAKAKQELVGYIDSPYSPKYVQASWNRAHTEKPRHEVRARSLSLLRWNPLALTSVLEIICVVVFAWMFLDKGTAIGALALSHDIALDSPFDYYRLLTPVFMHFGLVHIAFNLVMWEAFARPVENYLGSAKLFSLFISIALLSNVLQYMFIEGHSVFGGMSGVVYGLIGYVALLSRRSDLPEPLRMPKGLLTVSIIFIALGFLFSGIANFCHLAGLLMGLAWGYVDSRKLKFS